MAVHEGLGKPRFTYGEPDAWDHLRNAGRSALRRLWLEDSS